MRSIPSVFIPGANVHHCPQTSLHRSPQALNAHTCLSVDEVGAGEGGVTDTRGLQASVYR
jgi:hypothetical protein